MYTKTTFKRISLVAVASLGFGVLSVAPSFATATATTLGALGDATASVAVGSAATTSVSVTAAGAGADVWAAAAILPAGISGVWSTLVSMQQQMQLTQQQTQLLQQRGEAVVLTESDIRNGRVYKNKSIHGGTKSQSGNRVVPLVGDFQVFPKSPKTLRKVFTSRLRKS